MRRAIPYIAAFAGTLAFVFLCFAFAKLDINPAHWPEETRAYLAFFGPIAGLFATLAVPFFRYHEA